MKAGILAEMALLLGGAILTKKASGTSWGDLFLGGVLTKTSIAVALLTAILLTMDELGAGSVAVGFGGLIVVGYALSASGALGDNILAVEESFFGASSVVGTPTSAEGPSTNQAKGK